ncbi:hypothetical protein [Leucobacter sp. wl10]|uniref:hypothetical protein n=1 Tax=Leucobacter sp. wl10 TaxID=2304677 RepID=UPI000E5AB55B|nr:hypothetical protein [Leucobacter sp. wl10]RGE19081.1 hypothetical protein D1J51_13250 [Leucobacter sp. wl10]
MSQPALDGWALTRALSPRDTVRVALAEDLAGGWSNLYGASAEVSGPRPAGPWAMYLADFTGYRYLCFDLDAGRGNAAYDAGKLSLWLEELNVEHLTAISGPSGGRHIWIALAEATDPQLIRELADLAGSLLPSLDKSPLTNPATGCVRPPGTPHRAGGVSELERGSLDTLTRAATTVDDLALLRSFFVDAGATEPAAPVSIIRGMARDDAGHPYLVGKRREPSARIRAMLDAPPAEDTSITQAAVLAGLARARWRYDEVAQLLEHSPALEHARTRPSRAGRVPVPHDTARKRLAADWQRTVYYVAANPIAGDGQDVEFQARAQAVTAAVRAADAQANAMPGLWGLDGASRAARNRRGRYSHRAVLRAVCLYLVQAARAVVEVDVRRLAQDTGYGREACRLALIALSTGYDQRDPESAWLVRVEEAEGVHGASYRLSTRFSTEAEDSKWSQAVTRPPRTPGSDARTWWLNELTTALTGLSHDTFSAPGSLGRTAGRIYTALSPDTVLQVDELAELSGVHPRQARRSLRRLARHGLVERTANGWRRPSEDLRDAVAIALGVDGYLLERRARYDAERGTWAWWQAEVTWMRRRHKRRRRRRAPTGVVLFEQNDRPDYPKYPRTSRGRLDHAAARRLIREGILRPALELAVA